MMAMCAAVPPKLIQPNFHQNHNASANVGCPDSPILSAAICVCNLSRHYNVILSPHNDPTWAGQGMPRIQRGDYEDDQRKLVLPEQPADTIGKIFSPTPPADRWLRFPGARNGKVVQG